MTHELKTHPVYYQAVIDGIKGFELRWDDRRFEVEDVLRLREYDPATGKYTGRYCYVWVDYILRCHPGIDLGWCIMSVKQIV